MYMPLMVDIKSVTVFGGERGEGLQKTQKLSLFADQIVVVPEARGTASTIDLPAGAQSELKEKLFLKAPRSIPVHPLAAADLSEAELSDLIVGRTWVVSDLVDRGLNERIRNLADQHHVLCTIVDTKDLCTVWFMSLIQTEHLKVAISSGGTVSYFAPRLREYLTPLVEAQEREAAVLAEIRSQTPREQRESTLEYLHSHPEFRALVEAGTAHSELLQNARRIAGRKEAP